METANIELDRNEALKHYRKYLSHREHQSPVDEEVMRTYYAISKGRVVIKAIQSIIDAGLKQDGLPKLAIAPADSKFCHLRLMHDGAATFSGTSDGAWRGKVGGLRNIAVPEGSFPGNGVGWGNKQARAIMPTIPPDIRPERGLANYHVLWEAEWTPVAPRDPMLLRRIGKADLWIVLGAWDLTEVERAALSTRVHG